MNSKLFFVALIAVVAQTYGFKSSDFAAAQGTEDTPTSTPNFEDDEPPRPLYAKEQPEIEPGSKQDLENLVWYLVTSTGYEYQGTFDEVKAMIAEAEDNDVAGAAEDLDQMLSAMNEGARDEPGNVNQPRQGFRNWKKRSVIGSDGRTPITGTASFPNTALGQIALGCTGSFVRSHSVLTAGHCLYDRQNRRWRSANQPGYTGFNIYRGKTCGSQGGTCHTWKRACTVSGYIDNGLIAYDYGMIFYNQPSLEWFGFGYDNNLKSEFMTISGYPGDKNGCLYYSCCTLTTSGILTDSLKYSCDTNGGMSGSGLILPYKKAYIIYGIHTNGFHGQCSYFDYVRCYNSGTRITSTKYSQILSWIASYD